MKCNSFWKVFGINYIYFRTNQVEGARGKYIFEPRTIRRMELLVLGVLDWRLRSITPFSFIGYFACKLDSTGNFIGFLISQATEIILSYIQGTYIGVLYMYMHISMSTFLYSYIYMCPNI